MDPLYILLGVSLLSLPASAVVQSIVLGGRDICCVEDWEKAVGDVLSKGSSKDALQSDHFLEHFNRFYSMYTTKYRHDEGADGEGVCRGFLNYKCPENEKSCVCNDAGHGSPFRYFQPPAGISKCPKSGGKNDCNNFCVGIGGAFCLLEDRNQNFMCAPGWKCDKIKGAAKAKGFGTCIEDGSGEKEKEMRKKFAAAVSWGHQEDAGHRGSIGSPFWIIGFLAISQFVVY